jgi:hypothetical protein
VIEAINPFRIKALDTFTKLSSIPPSSTLCNVYSTSREKDTTLDKRGRNDKVHSLNPKSLRSPERSGSCLSAA